MKKKDMLLFIKLTLEDAINSCISRDKYNHHESATLEKARQWADILMKEENPDIYRKGEITNEQGK